MVITFFITFQILLLADEYYLNRFNNDHSTYLSSTNPTNVNSINVNLYARWHLDNLYQIQLKTVTYSRFKLNEGCEYECLQNKDYNLVGCVTINFVGEDAYAPKTFRGRGRPLSQKTKLVACFTWCKRKQIEKRINLT